jgi:iron(III) transport system permease protein
MLGKQLIEDVVLLPMSVPSLAFALGVFFFWLWIPGGLYGTIWIIVVALIGRYASYSVRSISSSLIQVHPELEESARICGLSWAGTLRRITLPLVLPSIVASWVMVYSIFVSELSIVLPLYTAETRTLSILSFDTWSIGQFSQDAALTLLQLVMGVGVKAAVGHNNPPKAKVVPLDRIHSHERRRLKPVKAFRLRASDRRSVDRVPRGRDLGAPRSQRLRQDDHPALYRRT